MFDMVVMIEYIGPFSTQDHYVLYTLNNKRWYKIDDSLEDVQVMTTKYNYFRLYHMDLDEILKSRPIIILIY